MQSVVGLSVVALICVLTPSYGFKDDLSSAAESDGRKGSNLVHEITQYNHFDGNDVMRCPYNCVCSPQPSPTVSGLSIDCKLRTGNASSLPAEIDVLLSALDVRLVTSLSIVNAALTSQPRSVCRLVNLENLVLDGNQLTALPDDCFTRMRGLKTLSASNNKIRKLQDGLFENLRSLTSLCLSNNELSYIGPRVFDVTANMTSLSTIDLQYNRLTSLDPWPMVRGQLVPGSTVLLRNNLIENFTNDIGWSHRCGQPSVELTLDLRWNLIRHAADIILGWNVTGDNPFMDVICALGFLDSYRQRFRLILDNNQFVCDCWDYSVISVLRQFHFVHWLDNNNCANLAYKKMTEVKLDELVCDVADPLCPPGCSCIKRPFNSTLLVNCPGSKLIDLPHTLPPLNKPRVRFDTKEKYEIRITGSALQRLELRDYLINDTVKLNVSGSAIETVSDEEWLALRNVRHIDLSHNRITTLSHVLQTENDTFSFKDISLHNNPLRCHCEDAWIRTWMMSLGTRLQEKDSVQCGSPYWMEGTIIGNIADDKDFCRMDPAVERLLYGLKIGIPSVAGAAVLVATLLTTFYRHRVYFYKRLKLHPFDRDECTGEDMKYDVYLFSLEEDNSIAEQLVDHLRKDSYRFFCNDDIMGGEPYKAMIGEAIEKSKRTIFVVSRNFLADGECLEAFRDALKTNLDKRKHRMIVVSDGEVEKDIGLTANAVPSAGPGNEGTDVAMVNDVKRFMNTHSYIKYGGPDSDDWWHQLRYELAVNKLAPQRDAVAVNDTIRQDVEVQDVDDNNDERQPLLPQH